MEDESDIVIAHTDGSSSRRDGSGGWAFRAKMGVRTLTRYGFADSTTNQAMELTAIVNVLEFITFTPRTLKIVTDSEYARDCLTKWGNMWARNGWISSTGAEVKNLLLVQRGLELIEAHKGYREVKFAWVRGHSGNPDNEFVDKLAGRARKERITNWSGGNH